MTSPVVLGDLTPEQIELLKNTVCKGATDDELALFITVCNRTKLDPFTKQIHAVKRWVSGRDGAQGGEVMTFQVGIDGLRLVAQRSGEYMGQIPALFYDAAGNGREVWLDSKPPRAARVGVLRRGFTEPLTAVALWDEYVQKTRNGSVNSMWGSKSTVMIAKCAEALALRKAFPQELSGLYIHEEMPSTDDDDTTTRSEQPTAKTRAQDVADMGASINASGDVVLNFGNFRGKTLPQLSAAQLIQNFRTPWQSEGRKAQAAERMGRGFVAAVDAELQRRGLNDLAITVRLATLLERRAAGEVLTDDEAEDVRQYDLDHAPKALSAGAA